MAKFNEIKIIGLDANRPPRIRKEAYIDLFYQLSDDAPKEWCEDFEVFGRRLAPLAKVDRTKRCFINTYVNDIDVIPAHFEQLKQAVDKCNSQFMEKLKQRDLALAKYNADLREHGGQQFKLNKIIASLDFDN